MNFNQDNLKLDIWPIQFFLSLNLYLKHLNHLDLILLILLDLILFIQSSNNQADIFIFL